MAIELRPETRSRALASIRQYFVEDMDLEIGQLRAGLLLDFCLEEICPTVYNQAIEDAQAFFMSKVEDLEGSCYEEEFTYRGATR